MINRSLLIIIIFFLKINSIQSKSLKFYEFHKNLFFQEILPNGEGAELYYYKLLKENPIEQDINYIVAPWNVLLYVHGLDKLDKEIYNLNLTNSSFCITIANYIDLIPLFKKIGIDVIFAANAMHEYIEGIKIVSVPFPILNVINPASKKDILYSFVGAITHKIREEIITMIHPKNTVIVKRDKFHYSNLNMQLLNENEKFYKDILSRSRFSLCPRGFNVGSIRFWESLQAEAIPILISDDYILPNGFDWDQCILRVKENDISKIPNLVSSLSIDKELQMRKKCKEAYSRFCNENLVQIIRNYYK